MWRMMLQYDDRCWSPLSIPPLHFTAIHSTRETIDTCVGFVLAIGLL